MSSVVIVAYGKVIETTEANAAADLLAARDAYIIAKASGDAVLQADNVTDYAAIATAKSEAITAAGEAATTAIATAKGEAIADATEFTAETGIWATSDPLTLQDAVTRLAALVKTLNTDTAIP